MLAGLAPAGMAASLAAPTRSRSGDNTIEVVAYNESNILVSLPASATIKFTGSADTVQPTMYMLAIGINAYSIEGGTRQALMTFSSFRL